MAHTYGNSANVIYEIYNEPLTDRSLGTLCTLGIALSMADEFT